MKKILILGILVLSGLTINAQQLAFDRLDALNKGCNFSNWLEAFWLDDADYPQTNQYYFKDVQGLKNAGMNGIRLNVNFERFLGEESPYLLDLNNAAMQYVDSVIVWADSLDMMVVLVNQHGWDDLNTFTYSNIKPRIESLWNQLANRYKNVDPDLLLFEIMNEPPTLLSRAKTRELMEEMTNVIRNYTNEHTIVVSGGYYSSGSELANTFPIADTNVIYTFHFYEPYWFTHQGASWTDIQYPIGAPFPHPIFNAEPAMRTIFQKVDNWRETHQLPVYMGEFGTINYSNLEGQCNWISLMGRLIDEFEIPWAYWDCKYSSDDRFGFFEDNIIDVNHVRVCYAEALRLYDFGPITSFVSNELELVQFHPNPATDVIQFSNINPLSEIRVFDALGKMVNEDYNNTGVLNIEGLTTGIYHVVFYDNNLKIGSGKFVKY